jgi:hypothetical protein
MRSKTNTAINEAHQIISAEVEPVLGLATKVCQEAQKRKITSALASSIRAMQTHLSYCQRQLWMAQLAIDGNDNHKHQKGCSNAG